MKFLKSKSFRYIVFAFLGLAAISLVVNKVKNYFSGPEITPKVYSEVKEEKVVMKLPKVEIKAPEKIKVIEKKAAIKKIEGLPVEVTQNENKQLAANADLGKTKGGYSVFSVIDTETGESKIIAKEKPQKFIEFINEGELGAKYGLSTDGGMKGSVHGSFEFVRVGNVRANVGVEVTTKPEANATVGLTYRW